MIGLNNINFNPPTYLNVTEKLQKDNNPPDPITLGLKKLADYKHVDYLETLAANGQGGFPLQNITVDYRIQKSKKNIQALKDSGETCYFLNHQTPMLAF